jgi:hypothetical protein
MLRPELVIFLISPVVFGVETSEEHLPTSIAGVLRLRAKSRPLCDRFARRFAQDDGFLRVEKHLPFPLSSRAKPRDLRFR